MTASNDVFLAHYGVKGMRWGVRRKSGDDGGSGGSGGGEKGPTRREKRKAKNEEIMKARNAQAARLRKLQEAEGDFYVARTAKGQDAAEKVMRRLEKEFFTNPDAATAAKLTTGEKVANGLSVVAMGLSVATILAGKAAATR